ncbi:MAG: 5-oxoprolinase subunit PxpA [Gemmatimonadaceae bacterium]
MAKSIDLNADIGEYTGTSGAALDDSILDLVSSASIACGGHAGDLEVMQRTVDSAASRGVAIGAHPSYPDRENFGRREMQISEEELEAELVSQIEALAGCCAKAGVTLRYVKPHGALYNVAARNDEVARVIAKAVQRVNPSLALLGLAHSTLIYEAERAGLTAACEAFADRAYLANGTLLSRDRPGSVLHDANVVAHRALVIARDHYVETVDGVRLEVKADSLCIHGDNPEAIALVNATKAALEADGFVIRPFA